MPVVGRKPKPEGQRRNRVKPTHDWVEVPNVRFEGAPPLPRCPGGTPVATKRWWKAISGMPHCAQWDETDWQFAFDTAILAAAFHRGDLRQAAELRRREAIMGTTADARMGLRIRYVSAEAVEVSPGEAASVTAMADYRAMADDDG